MTYQGSEQHRANALAARKKASKQQTILKEQRQREYYTNPRVCQYANCDDVIPYGSMNKFCSKSCSAKNNNTGRKHTRETKNKISEKLSKVDRSNRVCGHCKVVLISCRICEKKLYQSITTPRSTCSRECQTIAATSGRTYPNGSRKPVWYFNRHQDKDVLLESSWEVKVAERLDELGTVWTRPDPIKWTDSNGKDRLYFPDFFIPHLNTYLDPKNPYCIEQDQEKLEQVCKKITLVFGPVEDILSFIHENRQA